MQLVYLEWHDAACQDAWVETDDAFVEPEVLLCRTFGWLVDESDGFITVAHTADHNEDHVRGTITIPKACVQERIAFGNIMAVEKRNMEQAKAWLKNTSISTTATPAKSSE